MKCPINRGKYPFEGGDKCVCDCALRRGDTCAFREIADNLKEIARTLNEIERKI